MLKNYTKSAFRNIAKRKLFSFINILGLALGLAFACMIGIYVYENNLIDEAQPENIYRVITSYTSKQNEGSLSAVGRALVPAIQQEIPEAKYVVPVYKSSAPIKIGNEYFYEKAAYVGADFFNAFNFPLLAGEASSVLKEPYTAVITENLAEKYFKTTDVIGKSLFLNDTTIFKITGIAKNLPPSHINLDIFYSFDTWEKKGGDISKWFNWDMLCYVALKDNVDIKITERKISALSMAKNRDEYATNGYNVQHKMEPVRDIYLKSESGGINRAKGNIKNIYIFSAIGVALLLLAIINFINLSTAYQGDRGKEVGVKKTMGASATSLAVQFMLETFVMVLMATVVAAVIAFFGLRFVSDLTDMNLSFQLFSNPTIILATIALVFLTTVLAGLYPSTFLAGLRPVDSIKGKVKMGKTNFSLRSILVVFQFTISLILVLGTIIATQQLNYIHQKDLGFNKDEVLAINLSKTPRKNFVENYESFKHQLLQLPGVKQVAGSAGLPGSFGWDGQLVVPEGFSRDNPTTMEVIPSDQDYVKTLDIEIKAGRDFSKDLNTDATNGVLLNEAACRKIGWQPNEAIGKMISTSGMDTGYVIGVMADYHQHGLQDEINPIMIFGSSFYTYNFFGVKIDKHDPKKTINAIENFWKEAFPGYPLEWSMINDDLNKQYKSEINLAKMVRLFSSLTIFIAMLGLVGLVLFMVSQRTKEIGMRKVLGAGVGQIISLLSKDFVKLVTLAVSIALPVSWWLMQNWLETFSYRITVNPWAFVITTICALTLTFIVVGMLTYKTANSSAVKSLRSE